MTLMLDDSELWTKAAAIRDLTDAALRRYVPVVRDDRWLADTVDEPRFGWDWTALEEGFLKPLHAWASAHPSRTRPVVAALLIDALGGDYRAHACELAALEVRHIGSVMLEACRNGQDLRASAPADMTVPMPVLVTVAYNARQLAPVLVFRHATSLSAQQRHWLGRRFARSLWYQGLGATLNMWGAQCGGAHRSAEDFTQYLRMFVGPLAFALSCDVASAASGLAGDRADLLARAGAELGVAVRLGDASAGEGWGEAPGEQHIRWTNGVDRERARRAQEAAAATALAQAGDVSPAVRHVFVSVLRAHGAAAQMETAAC